MSVTRYAATARREDEWWVIRVPGLEIGTRTPNREDAVIAARDLIAAWLELPPAAVVVDVTWEEESEGTRK